MFKFEKEKIKPTRIKTEPKREKKSKEETEEEEMTIGQYVDMIIDENNWLEMENQRLEMENQRLKTILILHNIWF